MSNPDPAPTGADSTEAMPDRKKVEVTTQRLPLLRLSAPGTGEEIEFPERYRLREDDGLITCLEAPTMALHIERGLTFTANQARSKQNSIFIDGAAKLEPLLDTEEGIINLDHHEDCVRPFTLSACEQAYVIVKKGFDLQSRTWTLYANEPDLDTLLAIWVLFNHRRLRKESKRVQASLIPMLRLEGAIDVHGFELRHFAGLTPEDEAEVFGRLELLRREEAELKQNNEWVETDLVAFTLRQLHLIDRLVYQVEDFEGEAQIEELARTELPEKKLAIACRSEVGIYEVEEQLKKVYDQRLALIILQKGEGVYTLRQSNAFSRAKLDRIYERLNLLDPAAGNSNSKDRWGGSSDIGGSPRSKGTKLSVNQIVEACRAAGHKLTLLQGLTRFSSAALAGLAAVIAAAVPYMELFPSTAEAVPGAATTAGSDLLPAHALSSVLLLLTALVIIGATRQGTGLLGFRKPKDLRWMLALPAAIICALAGGSWALDPGVSLSGLSVRHMVVLALYPIACELMFRGAIYGTILDLWAGHRKRWYGSARNLTALIYGVLTPLSLLVTLPPRFSLEGPAGAGLLVLAAVGFGLAMGWAREESESAWAPMLLHLIAAVTLLLL